MVFLLTNRQQVFLRRQWQLFLLALMFFTRFPVGQGLKYSKHRMNQANRYFSLVGIVLGMLVALSYLLFAQYFPVSIALVLAMVVSVLLTGAFHQDGLADMADGIGGGYTPDARLAIMKDSRIGTYGAITLVLALLLQFQLWLVLAESGYFLIAVILAYSLSRALAASLIYNTDYVADSASSKSKPLAAKQSKAELMVLLGIAALPVGYLLIVIENPVSLVVKLVLTLFLFRYGFRRWLIARLGGFTGDCLGAAQQLSELIIYLVLVNHFMAEVAS